MLTRSHRVRRTLVVLATASTVTLAACGGSSSDASDTTSSSAASSPTTTEAQASTYATIPLDTTSAPPTATTVPADPTALRTDGIGMVAIGMPLADALAAKVIANPHAGCDGGPSDQYDLTIAGVNGTVQVDQDELQVFTVRSGRVDGAGSVGDGMDAFVAASTARYSWELDQTWQEQYGIWIGTLTDKVTGDTIDVSINPTSKVIEEAAAPYLGLCE